MDVTPLSLGIKNVHGLMDVFIPTNTTIPAKKEIIYTTCHNGQTYLRISVYEGERTMAKENRLLGTFNLSGIRPAARRVPDINICFEIDSIGILVVAAEEKQTGNKSKMIITNNNKDRLSKEEIEKMIKEAEYYKLEGEEFKKNAEAKIALEYDMRHAISNHSKINAEDKKKIADAVGKVIHWLEYENQLTRREEVENKMKKARKPLQYYICQDVTRC
ncbi:hypothetical protein M0R45_024610 [Rubus argutus]|uniref:Heat shock protein 70 n=1 Tax=Rubus argutus TaxID=59490 RepID=A0AAW1WS19_RUBAR